MISRDAAPTRRRAIRWLGRNRGGLILAITIALASSFLSEHYAAPAMLFALLIGMAFNFMNDQPGTAEGIGFASSTLLRLGVALLGLRLTFTDVSQLGVAPIVGVVVMLAATILGGIVFARLAGRSAAFGLLSGGAVAICGASAALAIAAVVPKRLLKEEDVLLTVVGVTAMSTLAMVVYPLLFTYLGAADVESGYMIGATIHDVAQVVGAGYSVSDSAGDIATFTKLLRVAMLPVVLLLISLIYRKDSGGAAGLPWFVIAFVALMIVRNTVPLPEALLSFINDGSRFLLVIAISALGVKTSLQKLLAPGLNGIALIAADTLFLLGQALIFAHLFLL
ncbi:putative sulfate exporter family transporter [Paracoccus sp. TK19116]|uniref:Sulfate exporter family transporter n=1 Tax=Paracoccus albicereus TaxID=2922394 RepID=A0ABT1MMS0_9RHOB|nr:putative sulfate exporter family transporter [Paracoccus albicereus]MCQ0969582.1 putative sulfate exporter family transporter [Paracoccus albicereus]